jgi:hypothetical protein
MPITKPTSINLLIHQRLDTFGGESTTMTDLLDRGVRIASIVSHPRGGCHHPAAVGRAVERTFAWPGRYRRDSRVERRVQRPSTTRMPCR